MPYKPMASNVKPWKGSICAIHPAQPRYGSLVLPETMDNR